MRRLFLKSLVAVFLCSSITATVAKDAGEEPAKPKAPLLSLKEVHKETSRLAPLVEKGEQLAPPGYALYSLPVTDDETNKVIAKTPILLSRRNIVGTESVQNARVVPQQIGTVAVTLTKEGGKRVTNATKKMQLGLDRIAVVLEGKCLIAPTVQAVLSRDFIISGLENKDETKRVVNALNAPIAKAPKK